jgi:tripartite-type tricarboxylate transporter receptor subunit TctC
VNLRNICLALAVAAGLIAPAFAHEQIVHIIFPFSGGGSGDALTRIIADQLGAELHRPVIVELRPGAAGRIGVQAVKSAEPDGNTLLMTPIAPMAVYQSVYPLLGYDPIEDFQPVAQIAAFEFGIAVGNDIPAKTLQELVAWIKANPSRANYGTPGAGTLPHFFGVIFGRAIGVDLQPIAYKGGVAALTDLLGGQIPMMFHSANELVEMHKAGKIRVLATSNSQRSIFLPDVPTFREAGYDIQGTGWFGIFAPSRTPADVVNRLNGIIVGALAKNDIQQRILNLGLQPTGTSAEAFAKILRDDIDLWAPAVKASGFTPSQ